MKIAFIVFDDLTMLDFVGFHDPVTRLKTMGYLPDLEWRVCARTPEVDDGRGLRIQADSVGEPLGGFDMIFIPGGMGTRTLKEDGEFIGWIRTAEPCRYKVSVCTGSLILGAAGFLEGRTATTHPSAYDLLGDYTPKVSRERIVDEGDLITGGGVATSIDLGLYLCERFAGSDARAKIQKQMDYPYQAPPALRPQSSA
ncbi:MAG: DJ-1/PfpI family protein [bacterium]